MRSAFSFGRTPNSRLVRPYSKRISKGKTWLRTSG